MARSAKPNAQDETPKGTWTILLVYAGVIAALWGYSYLTMLMQR